MEEFNKSDNDSFEEPGGNYYEPMETGLPDIHTFGPPPEVIIKVTSSSIKEGTLSKHVVYTIDGYDSSGNFVAYRRYKDFLALRNTLVMNWPGCFILQIPPKKITGKLETAFIEHRRKLLDLFLKRCASSEYLFKSEEFQMFIRGADEYHKTMAHFRKPNFTNIMDQFNSEFSDFVYQSPSDDDGISLSNALETFQSSLKMMENFEGICKNNVKYFSRFQKELSWLMQGIKDISQFYAENYGSKTIEVTVRESFHNPYAVLLDWTRAEILELKGMIEAIMAKYDLDKSLIKLQEKLNSEQGSLGKLQQGKKPLMSILTGKSLESQTKNTEGNIEKLNSEHRSLTSIIGVVTVRLARHEIPLFRQKKIEKYEFVMHTFTSMTVQEFESLITQAKQIEDSLNF